MGYYIRDHVAETQTFAMEIAVAAIEAFRQLHTIEEKPYVQVSIPQRLVQVTAGETEMFTFEELGF